MKRLLLFDVDGTLMDADGAGRAGAAMLVAHSRRVVPALVPSGGDLTGFWHAGGDLRPG